MITLHVYGPKFGVPDPSPFCMKAISLLKFAGLDYKLATSADPRKAPKGKQPWADINGTQVPDSTFIRLYLEEHEGIDFYPGLDPSGKATAWAFEKMCEEHLYWTIAHDRWMIDANFDKGPRQFFDALPALLRPALVPLIRKAVRRDLKGQGIGRHAPDQIVDLARRDIQALSQYLGNKPYFMGDALTGADAVVHAFVVSALVPLFDGPIRQAALTHKNLTDYVERLNEHWYPGEIDKLT